jgi:hypothetical protein
LRNLPCSDCIILVTKPPVAITVAAQTTTAPPPSPLPPKPPPSPPVPSRPSLPLTAMATAPEKPKTANEQFAELRVVIDNLASSMATMQGNQGQLTVVTNHLQLEKVLINDDKDPSNPAMIQLPSPPGMATNCSSLTTTTLMTLCHGSTDVSSTSASKTPRTPTRSSWHPFT